MSAHPGMLHVTSHARPTVLVIISDLLFRSRIDDAARRQELDLRVARSMEQLERHLARGAPALVIVDLEIETLDPAAVIARLRAGPGGAALPIVAYAGHTNLAAIEAGRAAGAVVLARSGFMAQLPDLLARAAKAGGAHPAASPEGGA